MRAKPQADDPHQLSLFDAPLPAAPVSMVPPATGARSGPSITLGSSRIPYELRRTRRKSIGFFVGHDGLSVNAPRWVSSQQIEAALAEKADWILRKLAEQDERTRRLEAARIVWRDGERIPFLGSALQLQLDAQVVGAMLDPGDASPAPGARVAPRLRIGLPADAQAAQIRDVVQGWLQRQALRLFGERCALYADRLDVRMTRLAISSAQTRWGSASADGSIRLNWRLVHFGLSVIDYVVVHELAHLREMNHSAAFWDIVRSVVPDYQNVRGRLKDAVLPAL